MKALIIYESMYGNTRDVAFAMADELSHIAHVEAVEVGVAPDQIPVDIDLVIVGGPTHQFGMTRASSREQARAQAEAPVVSRGRGVREWLDTVEVMRDNLPVATFDTTMKKPWFLQYMGRASRRIAGGLQRKGCDLIVAPESFWVSSGKGPMVDGELERAGTWAVDVAAHVPQSQPVQVPA
jgi:hypothetical protein